MCKEDQIWGKGVQYVKEAIVANSGTDEDLEYLPLILLSMMTNSIDALIFSGRDIGKVIDIVDKFVSKAQIEALKRYSNDG